MKALLLSTARVSGLFVLSRAMTRHQVRILTYHGVDVCQDDLINFDRLQVEPGLFRQQMELLGRQYTVKPLAEVLDALERGQSPGRRVAVITFDDGYRNNVEVAAPILETFGFPATFFVTAGFVAGTVRPWWYVLRTALARSARPEIALTWPGAGEMRYLLGNEAARRRAIMEIERRLIFLPSAVRAPLLDGLVAACGDFDDRSPYPFMGPNDVAGLAGLGFEIGSHTMSHISLRHERPDLVRRELAEAGELIHRWCGLAPASLAYPYGLVPDSREPLREVLVENGIRAGLTTVLGFAAPGDDVHFLRRLDITGSRDRANFESLLSGFTLMVSRLRRGR